MVGLLVHGDNHFVVHGPLPDRVLAHRLFTGKGMATSLLGHSRSTHSVLSSSNWNQDPISQ
jgi:hypothetical protein